MRNPLFKERYKGRGIYWHGGSNYGDETNIIAGSIRACRERIDALEAERLANRPDHEKCWDTVQPDERDKWRKLSMASDLSASELAWTNRPCL